MKPSNKAAMDEVEQQIIDLQERVLDLHKQKRAMAISEAYYNAQVNEYSQQLAALEARQEALQVRSHDRTEICSIIKAFGSRN